MLYYPNITMPIFHSRHIIMKSEFTGDLNWLEKPECFLTVIYLLVLISRDSGEDSLREAEGLHSLPTGYWLVWRQFTAEILSDDMNTGVILVHGVEDDLKI